MDYLKLMEERHSVRRYKDKPVEEEKRAELIEFIKEVSKESGLDIIPVFGEPECFDSILAHYGKFEGVSNYIVISGKPSSTLSTRTGYYGEKIVLKIQDMGMNSCWVALTRGKIKADIKKGYKVSVIISFGYGTYRGLIRKSKTFEDVSAIPFDKAPEWYKTGIKYALLAPTAMNQQRFRISYEDGICRGVALSGFYTKMDLGIVKYHFDLASGKELNIKNF